MCFLGYPPIIFYQLFFSLFDVFQVRISIRIETLWVLLLLQFSTHHFKLCILVLHGLKMCVWFRGYPPIIFYQLFHCFDLVFSRSSTGIDTLWVQLLEFFTNHFETMHICFTWSDDVQVVLGLSSYHTILKSQPYTDKAIT